MSEAAILEPPSNVPAASMSQDRARYLGQLSGIKRRENKAKREAAKAQAETPARSSLLVAQDYAEHRIQRVRAQLERIDGMIAEETNPQSLDRLVSAQTRLSEQWRILSGIPLPGSRRPGRETKGRVDAGPVEPL